MNHRTTVLLLALLLGLASACGGHRQSRPAPPQPVQLPPRIDLAQLETLGIVEFESSAEGELGSLATERFTDWSRRDQGLVRIVDLGERRRLSGTGGWNLETLQALDRDRGVKTLVTGELTVSEVRPDFSISSSLRSGTVSGTVEVTLDVRMIETATGASIWNRSARTTRTVGQLRVIDGRHFAFDADDPQRAYGELVDSLVEVVTRDFRVSWQ
jgi:hypothetical protein